MSEQPPAAPSTPAPGADAKPIVTFEDFAKLDLRVAKIVHAEDHPKADRLFKLQLDDGSGQPRQICAGIKGHYAAADLVGKSIVIVANLAPRVIRGEESRGMLLAASDKPKDAADDGTRRVVILTTATEMPPGSTIS
jgi:methionine--tRNA ligase beta chain